MNSIIYGTNKMTYKFNMSNYISNTKTVFTIQQPKRVQMVSQAQQARAEAEAQQAQQARDNILGHTNTSLKEKKEKMIVRKLITVKGGSDRQKDTPVPDQALAKEKKPDNIIFLVNEKNVASKLITVKGGSDTQRKAPAPANRGTATILKRIK
jgi:trehalose/maltose hydrolase-like predicted phosphorylase